MSDVVVGLVAMVAGAFLCFLGRVAARIMLSVWGAFVGFAIGATVAAAISGTSPFATWLGWVVGIVLGLLFAGLAHTFYALAVAITMGSIGYGLGAGLVVALGAPPLWVHVAGVVLAVVLAVGALATNLPDAILIALTALSGAGAIVAGLMLLTGVASAADFTAADIRSVIGMQRWWWLALYAVLAVAGMLSQSRSPRRESLRAGWGA